VVGVVVVTAVVITSCNSSS